MERFDRLTALVDRFKLVVRPALLDQSNLQVIGGNDGIPKSLMFHPMKTNVIVHKEPVLFAANVDWNGNFNPLLAALPKAIKIDLSQDPDSMSLVMIILSEAGAQRCGVDSVLNRLGEVLIVRILRVQIEAGSTNPGLLAGLSDARLSRAIVAMHDGPGLHWRNEDLAQVAGLSLSHFAEIFLVKVGEPPATYLRRWRLTLARQDLTKGDRVDAVARRYGFSSAEGFTKAFQKFHGVTPISLRLKRGAIQ